MLLQMVGNRHKGSACVTSRIPWFNINTSKLGLLVYKSHIPTLTQNLTIGSQLNKSHWIEFYKPCFCS